MIAARSDSENRRDDSIPIRQELAEKVAGFFINLPEDKPLFIIPKKTSVMLEQDLKLAQIPKVTSEGTCDFHALRHTFITHLARSGVAPAVAKALARHSTIVLTMDHYTHLRVEDSRAALKALSFGRSDQAERPAKTGTK